MAVITIPVSNLLVVKDQQGQSAGLVRVAPSVATPAIGSLVSAWEGIGFVTKTDARGDYRVATAFRNRNTGQVVPNPLLTRPVLQDVDEAFPDRFKPKPKPRPSRAGGRNSGGGGGGGGGNIAGGGGAPPVFAGSPPARIEQLQSMIAAGGTPDGTPVTTPGGSLTDDAQAALIEGLDLDEYTPALVAWLAPTQSVEFLVYDAGPGSRIAYIEGRMLTADSLHDLNSSYPPMNFPTAYRYALAGRPIARQSWAEEFDLDPPRWITYERGAWFENLPNVRRLMQVGDEPSLTESDYLAQDWRLPTGAATGGVAPQPDFPRSGDASTAPRFDVYSPPASI